MLRGRFGFQDYGVFRSMVDQMDLPDDRRLVFDLAEVTFVDSAGLGMLMVVREEMADRGGTVVLRGARGQVRRMIETARLDRAFEVEH